MALAQCRNPRIRFNLAKGLSRSQKALSLQWRGYNPANNSAIQTGKPPGPVIVVVVKWPRRRGHPKSPITRDQVALWDLFLELISQLDPVLYNECYEQGLCSMKYVRDIIISCGFGNYVSWPGHGKYPDGRPPAS